MRASGNRPAVAGGHATYGTELNDTFFTNTVQTHIDTYIRMITYPYEHICTLYSYEHIQKTESI
jgi:hypothetical protein